MTSVGYAGMVLLLASYLVPLRALYLVQFAATFLLLAYAVAIVAWPFIVLDAACGAILAVRLARRHTDAHTD